ncbi:GAF domain-containing protein [Kitasatospora sp. NPDC088783]|uniref:GAF domain-containing protein n=1 Tax=Kitasatospora sp. NPDC088783 TaxID=3364077 RepID=UPI00380661D9
MTPSEPALSREQFERARRIGALDLMQMPGLDDIAARIGVALGQPYAMVNLITNVQTFAGLYSAPGMPAIGRTMRVDHGYCPALLDRDAALVLPDVQAWARFSSNPVVDGVGIRTYVGAPLPDPDTGMVLGTVCAVGTQALHLSTGRRSLAVIKEFQAEVTELIAARARTH